MRLLVCFALASSLGCSGGDSTSTRTPATTSAPLPSTREHANPSEDTLGTLPEGYGIEVGQSVPAITVHDMDGAEVALSSLWSEQPVLLVFYRGGWCPYCNFQIHELTESFLRFTERGVGLAAISVDRAEESARTTASWQIPFPVLSDQDLAAHRAFRVVNEVDPATVDRLGSMGMDLEQSSGRDHHVIAVPAIFLIDREGVVRWAHADLDYRTRPSPAQVLGALP